MFQLNLNQISAFLCSLLWYHFQDRRAFFIGVLDIAGFEIFKVSLIHNISFNLIKKD